MNVECLWDLADDPEGNVQHISEHGVTIEEVEEVVRNRYQHAVAGRRSGRPTVFGSTSTGKHLAVAFDILDANVPQVYVVTAYETPAPAAASGRRRKR